MSDNYSRFDDFLTFPRYFISARSVISMFVLETLPGLSSSSVKMVYSFLHPTSLFASKVKSHKTPLHFSTGRISTRAAITPKTSSLNWTPSITSTMTRMH